MYLKYKITLALFLVFLFLNVAENLEGQAYTHSAGVRAGFSSGITYKGFFDNNSAAALELLYNRNGLNISILYAYHIAPFDNERYMFYVGGGLFSGTWEDQFSLGISGVAGFEYVVREVPLVFSVDWKPMFNIIKETGYELVDFGISIRYYFEI